jgi:hypothetical protein
VRISFDLDDTLICFQPAVPREPALPWYLRLFAGKEPLRRGARELLRTLTDRGWEIWIYTTSHRRSGAVRAWLRCHGVRVAGVINQSLHDAHHRQAGSNSAPSKNPAAFGIVLHVDDSEGVRLEGEWLGFAVVVVTPDDANWTEKVLLAAEKWEPR